MLLLMNIVNESVEFYFQMFRLLNDAINESVVFCFKTRLLNSVCRILF